MIDSLHILTAAHCLRTQKGNSKNLDDIVVLLGSVKLIGTDATFRSILKYYYRKEYVRKPLTADIAVISVRKQIFLCVL